MAPILAIVGPTATGKSTLALALAERLGGEIVNADALQVYRGLDIGTAKPSMAERQRVPHHLIDVLDAREPFSAGEFARRGRVAIADIRGRGKLPIVVGGSGLYQRALLEGIGRLPASDPEIRRELARRLAAEGLPALRDELRRVDPLTERRLAAGDRQRVLRALEVYRVSGQPLSRWLAREPFGQQRLEALRIGLTLPRPILYDRIADRARRMIEQGWVEEVARLLASGLDPSVPAFQAIGYRQLAGCLREEWGLEDALRDIIRATRQFAKRQETWYRREPDVHWFAADHPERLLSVVIEFVDCSGLGGGHDET